MTRPDIQYRARTIVHLLELLDGPTSVDPEFKAIRSAIQEALPKLEELTGEILPEQVEPMSDPVGAFYLMVLADALEGVVGNTYQTVVPKIVEDAVHWLCQYFRGQLERDFLVRVDDWR